VSVHLLFDKRIFSEIHLMVYTVVKQGISSIIAFAGKKEQ
jgi:hypothetical protein